MNELEVADRRGKAVEVLRASFSADDEAAKDLEQALAASDALAQTEFVAMKIAAEQHGVKDLPKKVQDANVNLYKREGDNRDAQEVATNLVLNETYEEAKKEIRAKVEESSTGLLNALENELDHSEATVQSLLFQLRISVALLLCAIMVLVLTLFMYVLKPLGQYVARIKKKEPLKADGAYELHYLANAYNVMYEDNAKRIEQLRAFAERDPLTGISNRSGYDNFLATHTRNIVLLLMDIDNFGDYNAVYGHETGDAVLIRLAKALGEAFRSTDFPCRIESDTFAVIMTNVSMDVRDVIVSKVELVNTMLAEDSDELPLVTLSVGAAFSTEGMTDKEIYRAANDALMDAMKSESNSIVFYGENNSVR
jgi:diguanylate cyclase (GGDEF)-like protein